MRAPIPFNKPHLTGKEYWFINRAVKGGRLCGNNIFTRRCDRFFERRYGFRKALLTTSCTDALEMAALLSEVGPGDEVIVPSYTFVSSALAFVRQGAKIVFADSYPVEGSNPNVDPASIEALITPRTKVIVPVHYAGMACDMDAIMDLAEKHNLLVVEDAAQAIESFHIGKQGRRPLGSIGALGCFSFHETKNLVCGEGGLLTINDPRFIRRSEIIWEKGTNRAEFFRGEVNKYGWVDIGSSFLPSEVIAAFLYAQCSQLDDIQARRIALWNRYYEALKPLADKGFFKLPEIPPYATNNAHMFYLIFPDLEARTAFIRRMKEEERISCVFHYLSLHKSPFHQKVCAKDGLTPPECPNADAFSDRLVRLPMFYDLPIEEVIAAIHKVLGA